jgi:hypothetical protein
VKRMIKVLAVAVLIAVILVASTSPVLARRAAGGHQMSTEQPCEEASAERGAHFEKRNKPEKDTCWLRFPTHND